jgi:hypothetical protein
MILGQKLLKLYLCEKIHRLLRQRSENPERLPRKSGRDPHLCVYLQNAEAFTFPKKLSLRGSAATEAISGQQGGDCFAERSYSQYQFFRRPPQQQCFITAIPKTLRFSI